jgi:hypothetical protein
MSLQTLIKSQCRSTNKYYDVQYEVLVVYDGEQMIFPFNTNRGARIFSNNILRRFTRSTEPIGLEDGRHTIERLYKLARFVKDVEL